MFKTKIEEKYKDGIPMRDMRPCEIGVMTGGGHYDGDIVMRTANPSSFEVMNLSRPGKDWCWTYEPTTLTVSLLKPGTKITLEVE